jgi:anhydro-N-acetylmuramic acid kinase
MPEIMKVIGLMSGTSLDGVDAALLDTDGAAVVRPGASLTMPYDAETRALLRQAIQDAAGLAEPGPATETIRAAERHLTDRHADAVAALLEKAGLAAREVDLIGFHGQTILHRPEQGWTWQIGDGARLARRNGIGVVNDFRTADVQAGGQGAPLMPLYHAALAAGSALPRPLVVANIGGVGNVTYIDDDCVLAFDTGPGNAPIDDWMLRHTGKPVDAGGALAASGAVHDDVLAIMLDNCFFARRPPKSLDRMDFGLSAVEGLSAADGAATLAAFTAASIARAAAHFPSVPLTWIISGGGRHNDFLMAQLRTRLLEKGAANVLKAEGARWDGDGLEAEGFAYLAARSRLGLPLSLPTTTGVPSALTGGVFHPPGGMEA